MVCKERDDPYQLRVMELLSNRMELSKEEERYHTSLKKGLEGERLFDTMTEKLTDGCFVLNDLLLKVKGTVVQIDTLLIMAKGITLYEIKNYEGEYIYEAEKLYTLTTDREIINPLIQLRRSQTIIRQLMEECGFHIQVNGFVVFVNRQFTLYQAPPNQSLLLPTMLERHCKQVHASQVPVNSSHKRIAEKLCELHLAESPYHDLPAYKYEELKKGVYCVACGEWMESMNRKLCICRSCRHEELSSEAILRHVQEYRLLFPERKITTTAIQEWCGFVPSQKKILKVLQKHFQTKRNNRWSYFY